MLQITKPRTQRRKMFQAYDHIRRKYCSAALSSTLKEKHGANAFPVKVGDTVRVMRGDRKGFEGKIVRVDTKKTRIFIEGLTREKVDGTAIQIPVHPSKAMIVNLNLDDKRRRASLKRKAAISAEEPKPSAEKAVEKPEAPKKAPRKKKAVRKPRKRVRSQKEPEESDSEKKKKLGKTGEKKRRKTKKS